MLSGLGLKNFKAFGDAQQNAPFSKITLIYGPNSAGKSSIIQALLMLKQSALMAGSASTIWGLVTRGRYVDLGSYSALLHRHDSTKDLTVHLLLGRDSNHVSVQMTFTGVTDVDETGREYQEDSAILSDVIYKMGQQQNLVEIRLQSDGGSWWNSRVSTTNTTADSKILDYPALDRFLPEAKLLELELLLERNQLALPDRERNLVRMVPEIRLLSSRVPTILAG